MTLKNISFCIPTDGVRWKDMFLTKVRFTLHKFFEVWRLFKYLKEYNNFGIVGKPRLSGILKWKRF